MTARRHKTESPRFGQLSYTSFDRPGTGSGGGWQVKEVSGDLDADEQELLRAGVVSRFDSPQPMPRFPTVEDIARRPRRLMYARLRDAAGCYWHTVPAGSDASGRPGNVFAHAVLERGAEPGDGVRPIECWRSTDWLVPYGADEVAKAALPATAPGPGGIVDRDAALGFLLDPGTWRIGVFSVLLDAVARSLRGGPAVVLGCKDPDTAALWIGAVSHFMSPGTARRFGWSTFDRLHSVDDAVAGGANLVTVPLSDLPGDSPGCTVFGENETPELGELDGEPHSVANGDLVPVTYWSVLAQTVLLDVETAHRALARQDAIAAGVGDRDLTEAWPLAMAVVADPGLHDALDEAASVVLAESPMEAATAPDLAHVIVGIVDERLGATTQQAEEALARWQVDNAVTPAVRQLAGTVFAFRALGDGHWVRRAGPEQFAVVESCARTEDLQAEADAILGDLRLRARGGGNLRDVAFDALKTIDLLVRADLLRDRGVDVAFEVLERAVIPTLCDRVDGAAFVAELGPVSASTRVRFLQPALTAHPVFAGRPLGSRLAPPVLEWLVDGLLDVPDLDELASDPQRITEPECVLIADGVFALTEQEFDRARIRSELVPVALWRALHEAREGGWAPSDVPALVAGHGWTAEQWCRLVGAFPEAVAPRFLQDVVVREPWGPELETLVRHLAEPGAREEASRWAADPYLDDLAVSWALIRNEERWAAISGPALRRALDVHVLPVLEDYAEGYEADLPTDLLARLAIFTVALRGQTPPQSGLPVPDLPARHREALVRAVDEDARFVVDALASLVESGALDAYWLMAHAVFTSPSAPRVRSVLDQRDVLARFEVGSGGVRRSLLDEVASTVMKRPDYRGPLGVHGLMDAIREELHLRGHRDVAYACDVYAGFVRRWLDERRADADRSSPGRATPRRV
ncbi:hypothetical protein RAJCM14343_0533 [Rhodococcus aetherivorans]|uniref:Uncharacterized protein n=1 Tax=Rhodococcus aetherivorans TaxID=191292 RepID=A0ABQ0YFI6_9NOCA|nr:hypothetical protein [Rhodococcus aetherivorans]ETT25684.1 hypothetical protein RR21198_0130 [Rhodococcus rhodochrous ATCC 21198]MDV6292350.1 hypothetical protein [Rhodococcus aetherivorans]NGP26226.1 hypothetical protein [Rhodococcus aetherivorans]GES35286.1 hypothetical protein RAJCM14343_0533 [Rhodococcus aetherivorans]